MRSKAIPLNRNCATPTTLGENYKRLVNTYIYTGYKKGKDEGIELGEERGKHQEKLELAGKLRIKGMPDEEIVQLTGLIPKDLAGL
jgi:hypothetical protein